MSNGLRSLAQSRSCCSGSGLQGLQDWELALGLSGGARFEHLEHLESSKTFAWSILVLIHPDGSREPEAASRPEDKAKAFPKPIF